MTKELKDHIKGLSIEQLQRRLGFVKEALEREKRAIARVEAEVECRHNKYGWGRSYPVEFEYACRNYYRLQDEINFINEEIASR